MKCSLTKKNKEVEVIDIGNGAASRAPFIYRAQYESTHFSPANMELLKLQWDASLRFYDFHMRR